MLQLIHGGASARPFTTHANAIDTDLYLRIAPELFLKRAVVGGIERVFEINRNFRNEGMDSSHSPEFAMLEAYETYGNYDTMAELTKKLVQNACMDVFGTLEVQIIAENAADSGQDSDGGTDSEETAQNTVTYSFADDQWQKISLYESLSEALGENVTPDTDIETLKKFAKKHNLEKEVLKDEKHLNAGKLVELLWEELVGNDLYKPTFVYDFPEITSPLSSAHPDKPGVAQKWDLIVRGFELATAYSELVDPVIQRERLTAQSLMAAGGDAEAMQLDTDFIEALEYGMPPSGGMGMGVDRLLMAITGYGIRDTITFPLIKNA
jgi:lysyl-tRNA synthetase class 2